MSTRPSFVVSLSAAALALAGALAACKQPTTAPPPDDGANAAAVQLAPEDVAKVMRGGLAIGPRISGTLEAREHAVLRAELGGTVTMVGPDLGDPVKKGEVVARIESKALGSGVQSAQAGVQSAQAGVGSAQAAVDLARREVERTEALVKGGATPARELDRARANLRSAEAALTQARSGVQSARSQVASAQNMLGDSTIRSPIDGVVAKREASAGDVVTPGAMLYEIVVPSTMRLSGSASSEDLASLAVGRRVDFEVRGYPDQQFAGEIKRIAPVADPVTRQIELVVEIPNPGGKLIAGLYAEGRVSSEEKTTLILPEGAIDTSGDRPSVMRVKDGTAERISIATGLRDEARELVEVTSGLAEGELVILSHAARTIEPGAKVIAPGGKPAAAPPAGAPAPNAKPAEKPAEKPGEAKPQTPSPSASGGTK